MKVFVDTSVWINFLSKRNTENTKRLLEMIETGQSIYSLPVIIQEIFQGFKNDKDVVLYSDKFEALDFLPFEFQDAVEAAKLYRHFRKLGKTHSTIDPSLTAAIASSEKS